MKIIVLLVAAFCAVLAQRTPGIKDYCDEVHFKACTYSLGQYWNVDSFAIWESPLLLAQSVNQQLKPPYVAQNLINICNGLSLFNQCLGQDQVRICLGPIGWVGRNRSPTQAFAFDGMLNSLLFQCGAGFLSLDNNANVTDCMQRTTVNYDNEITQFYRSYELNVMHDPANACFYGQALVNGVSAIYGSGPCAAHKGHAQWFACEMTRQYVFPQFSHCRHQLKCAAASMADHSSMVREAASGDMEFLLPATWKQSAEGEWELEGEKWI